MLLYSAHRNCVYRDGKFYAEACNAEAANNIVRALNGGTKAVSNSVVEHHTRREGDEYACKCGKRWPATDGPVCIG